MKSYIRPISAVFTIILFVMSLKIAAQDKVGTSAAQFLKIPVGGKAIAMGGAYTAMGDDPSSIFWNPGAISRTVKSHVYASQTNWLVGSKHQWIGAQVLFGSANAIGFSINLLDYGDREPVTTVEEPDGTGEYWEASDMAFSLSYSRNVTDRFSIGGTAKYIQQKIWHSSSSQYAMDLGLLFITQFNGLRIGASMRNFGGDLQMGGQDLIQQVDLDPEAAGNNETIVAYLKTDKWPMPLIFSVGIAMPIIDQRYFKATVAADAVRPTDDSETLNVGTEILISNILSIRGGYQSLFRKATEQGLTAGLGLKLPLKYADIVVDYSFQNYGKFGAVQTSALSIGF